LPNYLVGIYEERFGTVIVQADDEMQAAERIEEELNNHETITAIPSFDEQSFDKGVAIDASDPEELVLAVTEIVNDS